ncbi:MBL fold metallo-hydrolase [Pilimelia terevasa]|uniref:MBL fold metallo-hydrolase n=1 Tax=Pilimelia terevasa TaxID=53372 RepID=A0A8J3BHJ9_9ACTN|nr:MBL fold metallo-hydrolase [Pilimelia terevasa]GGK11646.1 MBL fold metallo-hydrolase [Pilimelia terevasa]
MTGPPVRLTAPAAAVAPRLPSWVTLVRAPNPGPMTLDGTNTWVLRAAPGAPATVVDPGPLDEGHVAAVLATGPVAHVLLTHAHADHRAGLPAFLARSGAALVVPAADPGAQPDPGAPGARAARADGTGDRVRYRLDGIDVEVRDTPGHTADSRCFVLSCAGERVVATGDTILGRGTTVVAWPDGHLGDYLDSLAALAAYPGVPALTGHGPALADTAAAAAHYTAHRRARLAQVRAAVAAGADTPEAVVDAVYADVPPLLRTAATWSARAQLDHLAAAPAPPPEPAP